MLNIDFKEKILQVQAAMKSNLVLHRPHPMLFQCLEQKDSPTILDLVNKCVLKKTIVRWTQIVPNVNKNTLDMNLMTSILVLASNINLN